MTTLCKLAGYTIDSTLNEEGVVMGIGEVLAPEINTEMGEHKKYMSIGNSIERLLMLVGYIPVGGAIRRHTSTEGDGLQLTAG